MTDCFIMIHVIIFFVGVTDTLSGNRGAWFGRRQHRGCRCWYPKKCSVQRGKPVLRGCSQGWVVSVESLCKIPVGLGWDTPICMVGSRSRGTAEADPTAKPVTALTGGSGTASLPQQKQLRNWAIIHIQVPAICKYGAWGVHSTFLH